LHSGLSVNTLYICWGKLVFFLVHLIVDGFLYSDSVTHLVLERFMYLDSCINLLKAFVIWLLACIYYLTNFCTAMSYQPQISRIHTFPFASSFANHSIWFYESVIFKLCTYRMNQCLSHKEIHIYSYFMSNMPVILYGHMVCV
jgi:hypothetical protein